MFKDFLKTVSPVLKIGAVVAGIGLLGYSVCKAVKEEKKTKEFRKRKLELERERRRMNLNAKLKALNDLPDDDENVKLNIENAILENDIQEAVIEKEMSSSMSISTEFEAGIRAASDTCGRISMAVGSISNVINSFNNLFGGGNGGYCGGYPGNGFPLMAPYAYGCNGIYGFPSGHDAFGVSCGRAVYFDRTNYPRFVNQESRGDLISDYLNSRPSSVGYEQQQNVNNYQGYNNYGDYNQPPVYNNYGGNYQQAPVQQPQQPQPCFNNPPQPGNNFGMSFGNNFNPNNNNGSVPSLGNGNSMFSSIPTSGHNTNTSQSQQPVDDINTIQKRPHPVADIQRMLDSARFSTDPCLQKYYIELVKEYGLDK